jgi:hypothetical protein
MGATTFQTTATGKDASEAYKNAVDEAYYWNGHGGYSGTIAEKDGYDLWAIPALPEAKPNDLGHKPDTLTRLSHACSWYLDHRFVWEDHKSKQVDPFANWKGSDWEWENLAHDDALVLVKAMGADKFLSLCYTYNDKWGPAVAVKLSDNEYGFFGWASC